MSIVKREVTPILEVKDIRYAYDRAGREALCGVSKNDIYMDYETSFFSDMSGYDDKTAPSAMVSVLDTFRQTVQKYAKGRPLSEATRAFLIELGMTEAELDAIRANLLEDAR